MEAVLHHIEELQRLAEDLITASGAIDAERYETDCDLFLGRIEAFVTETNPENADYLEVKLNQTRAALGQLLRQTNRDRDIDLAPYQALVHNGLNSIYRSIRYPVTAPANDEYEN